MTTLEILEKKIRNAIPELKEEYSVFQEGAIDADMITQIGLNHVLEYLNDELIAIDTDGDFLKVFGLKPQVYDAKWNLKSAYLKDQSEPLINFLNELK